MDPLGNHSHAKNKYLKLNFFALRHRKQYSGKKRCFNSQKQLLHTSTAKKWKHNYGALYFIPNTMCAGPIIPNEKPADSRWQKLNLASLLMSTRSSGSSVMSTSLERIGQT